MLTFAVEPYAIAIKEMQFIYPEHWRELALDRDQIPLAPDYARYNAMEQAGMIHLIVARDNEEMVGYFIFFIMQGLHYRTSKQAFYDIFYLRTLYRRGRNGINFIKFAEQSLKEIGVQKMYVGIKVNHDFGKVFEYLGFTPCERTYTKMIG